MEEKPFGHYRLQKLLSRGRDEVWRAFDTVTEQVVAIKILPAEFATDPFYGTRFRREAGVAARVDEPHVVPIHDLGEFDGRLFVSMGFVDGEDLQKIIERAPVAVERAVKIVEQVALALDGAMRIDVIHRDIKPSKILVGQDDFAYLIGFGISRLSADDEHSSAGIAWAYKAPEGIEFGPTDERSDVYALACVLYECLTGERPFPGETVEQQVIGHLTKPPPRPSSIAPGIPRAFDAVIAKGMAKKPTERYATALELGRSAREAIA